MGKKGKGANKLAKMSEEARLRYLQHRADMEEEARRRKQQLIAIFMKNKLKREEAFSRLNLAKINQEWRFILRRMKCQEMKKELKDVETDFCNALERKDATIKRLLNDLDESEDMYATMLQSHMETIERLIVLHDHRLNFWKVRYYNEKNSLLGEYNVEIEKYRDRKTKVYNELECIFYGLQSITNEQKQTADDVHVQNVNNVKSEMMLKLELTIKDREQKMESIWKSLQAYMTMYNQKNEEYYSDYVDMKCKDDEDTKCIKNGYCEISKLNDCVLNLKYELDCTKEEQSSKLKQLLEYKKILQEKYESLNQKMIKQSGEDSDGLKHMVVCSQQTISELKQIKENGENLIQITAICQKLETEREKLLPFAGKSNKWFKTMFDNQFYDELPDECSQNSPDILKCMENFWVRYNSAVIDCSGLKEEMTSLTSENMKLKNKIKEYLTNVTLATHSLNGSQASGEKVRPHSMKVEKIIHIDLMQSANGGHIKQKKKRPVTCIEGNLSVAVRSQMLGRANIKTPPHIFSISRH